MKMLSEFVITLLKEWHMDDLPINVLIDDKYYDIDEFYFDKKIFEYVLKLTGGIDYNSRGDVVNGIIFNVEK